MIKEFLEIPIESMVKCKLDKREREHPLYPICHTFLINLLVRIDAPNGYAGTHKMGRVRFPDIRLTARAAVTYRSRIVAEPNGADP